MSPATGHACAAAIRSRVVGIEVEATAGIYGRTHVERVVIVGSGGLAYREYSFEALAARYELLAVLPEEPTWQQPYLTDHRVVAGPDDVLEAVGSLGGDGVLTLGRGGTRSGWLPRRRSPDGRAGWGS
jgi:hypothetical protein